MAIQWALVIFTLFICLSAGTFGIAGLLALLGKGQKLQIPSLILAVIALIVGGLASFAHLEHWDRIFNGFGNLSSGITLELIGIVICFVVMVIYFVVSRKGETPKWAGALALIVSLALVVVMSVSYLMPSRPVWSTPLLVLFYLAQAIAAGGAAVWLISAAVKTEDSNAISARITALGGLLVLVSLLAYLGYVYSIAFPTFDNYFDPTDPTKPMVATAGYGAELLSGSLAGYFWAAVILGGIVTALLGFLQWKKGNNGVAFGALALICSLGGGLAFRAALYVLGISIFAFY